MKLVITLALFASILAIASAAPATIAMYRIEGKDAENAAAMTPERIKAEGKAEWSFTSELPIGPAVSHQFVSPDLKVNVSVQAAQTRSKTGALLVAVKFDEERLQKQSTGNVPDKAQAQLKSFVNPGQSVIVGSHAIAATTDGGGKALTASSATYCLLTLGESKL